LTPEAKCWYYICVPFCFQSALCTTQHRTLAILQTIVVVQMLSLSELNINRHAHTCPTWAPCGLVHGAHMGSPYGPQIILATGSGWAPYGLPIYGGYVGPIWDLLMRTMWALYGPHISCTNSSSGPHLGSPYGPQIILATGSGLAHMGCPYVGDMWVLYGTY